MSSVNFHEATLHRNERGRGGGGGGAVSKKVQIILDQAIKAQRGSKGIALLFI